MVENVGSMKLLDALVTPVATGQFNSLKMVEMALPEADGASHLLQFTHLHISSAWPRKQATDARRAVIGPRAPPDSHQRR